jgi:hypothetical protein
MLWPEVGTTFFDGVKIERFVRELASVARRRILFGMTTIEESGLWRVWLRHTAQVAI